MEQSNALTEAEFQNLLTPTHLVKPGWWYENSGTEPKWVAFGSRGGLWLLPGEHGAIYNGNFYRRMGREQAWELM